MEKYEIIRRLGQGGCAVVHLVKSSECGRYYTCISCEQDSHSDSHSIQIRRYASGNCPAVVGLKKLAIKTNLHPSRHVTLHFDNFLAILNPGG